MDPLLKIWLPLAQWPRRWLKVIDARAKTRFISSIFRLLCIALWHYVCEHIIYTVYSDCVLAFAFAFLSCQEKKNTALNRTFSTESYRNWQKSINILKNNGLLLKNKQKF